MKSAPEPRPASLDPLTGLPDRGEFRHTLESELAYSARAGRPLGLLLFDIDRFKIVNYGYGEQQGNAVLQQVAGVARQLLRHNDLISRWGGQEFLCVLPNTDKHEAEQLAARLRAAIEQTVTRVDDLELRVTASFATASFPEDGDQVDKLLAACGAALHYAKASGRNRVVVASRMRAELYGAGRMLDQALRDGRVIAAFQPIVDLQSGAIVAEEALARVRSPSGRIIPASAFMETARELQLTHKIDRAILLQTFGHCVQTLTDATPRAHFVNVSGNLLHHPDVVSELLAEARAICRAWDDRLGPIKPLVIEVTERELLEDLTAAHHMLKPFLDFGLRLALDDFGSGYSSYRYLADLPFAFLKIDGELIRRVTEPRVRTIVQGIQRTAYDLGVVTLAEYVENDQIAAIVRDLGINWGQGYHFGAPQLPAT